MAIRIFTTQLMVLFSGRWLDPEGERPILERYPLTSALLPRLAQTHAKLIAFQRATFETQGAIAKLQERQAELDALHDRKMRGVFNMLTALAELSDKPNLAAHYLDLRDKLLPEGLRAVTRSYLEEAGEAVLLQGRLDAPSIQALTAIPTPDGHLYQYVEAWMLAATEIGKLERERLELTKKAPPDDTTPADVVRARNEWIRIVHAIRANLLLDDAKPEDIEAVFRHLDQAEAKADRRAPVDAKPQTPAEPPSPASPPAEPNSPCASDKTEL